jgi:hypothetical protein
LDLNATIKTRLRPDYLVDLKRKKCDRLHLCISTPLPFKLEYVMEADKLKIFSKQIFLNRDSDSELILKTHL